MNADILLRKRNAFVLWRVANNAQTPTLVIGELWQGTPIQLTNERIFFLHQDINNPDVWFIDADECGLTDGFVYHYWFEVTDSAAGGPGARIRITDPMATTVNWQIQAVRPPGSFYTDADAYPAAVIKFKYGVLLPCDIGGEEMYIPADADLSLLSPNNRLVMYEVPTAWTRSGNSGEREIGTGSFADVQGLLDPQAAGGNFADLAVVSLGRSYLRELGVNAIELLPPADSFYKRDWGYDTTNFFAPDFDLGWPAAYSWAAAGRDLQALTSACHAQGIRFFTDSVMAFSKQHPYLAADPDAFFIVDPKAVPSDPDAHNSRGTGADNLRNGFGSSLFRYARAVESYDPVSGLRGTFFPARQLMKAALIRWMNDFRIDGIRMDSIENVANWDFVEEYKDLAREVWRERYGAGGDAYFLVVGEELSEPLALLQQGRLNGLWHENFKHFIRPALTGHAADGFGESSFEWTVRKAIDCRNFGYTDLSEAIIYLTSHDVEGPGNERLYNYLVNNGITDTEKRIKLAFACMLTAVGIPMILAGEEFADQHDLFDKNGHVDQGGGKQVDPVNYSRLADDWRGRIKEYVSRLVACRTSNAALATNDTAFIHVDFEDGKRVMVWMRVETAAAPGLIAGTSGLTAATPGLTAATPGAVVIVVANFSDYGTPDPTHPDAEYVVPNWPATPAGRQWREVGMGRMVAAGKAGREPIFPWEAKLYELV